MKKPFRTALKNGYLGNCIEDVCGEVKVPVVRFSEN